MSSPDDPQNPERNGGLSARHVPFAKRVVIAVAIALGMIAVALFLWNALHVLLLAFAAVLVGAVLRAMAQWLAAKARLPAGGALAVVVVSLVGFCVLLGVLIAPRIVAQFERLADQLPQSVESAQERLRQYGWGRKILGDRPAEPTPPQQAPAGGSVPATQPVGGEGTVVAQAIEATTRPAMLGNVVNYGRAFFNAVFTLVIVLIVGVYLAAQPRLYVEGLLKLFPEGERPRLREVLHEVGRTLVAWTRGQLIPMAAVGVLTGVGLWFIGVPLWLPLAILAALLNFIPNFGPIIAAVPALLIAVANEPTDALWVAGLYLLAQNLEGYLIMPLVQRRAVAMPPALTIMSQVLLGLLLGPLGIILAAPLTAAALVVIKMLYVKDTLGTPVKTSGPS